MRFLSLYQKHGQAPAPQEFNHDFGASFKTDERGRPLYNFGTLAPGRADREGVSVFVKDDSGQVFRAYSSYARGIDMLNTAYHYLDLVPRGRDEGNRAMSWLKLRDDYGA